jgi:hypothetical protein
MRAHNYESGEDRDLILAPRDYTLRAVILLGQAH